MCISGRMDDPILARARLLINFASGEGDIPAPSSSSAITAAGANKHRERPPVTASAPLELDTIHGVLPPGSFYCIAIRGSRLLSTSVDVRTFVKKGAKITLDDVAYTLSSKPNCEWAANRLELSEDYVGETKSAVLSVCNYVKRSPTKKINNMEPLPSGDIRAAVAGLEMFDPASSISQHYYNPSSSSSRAPGTAGAVAAALSSARKAPIAGYAMKRLSHAPPQALPQAPPFADGGYLQNMQFQSSRTEDRMQEERNRATQRVAQKKKEDALGVIRKMKEEADRQASLHIAMESKARLLQEKTQARVAMLHNAKEQEALQKKQEQEEKMQKKLHSDLLVQSDHHKMRMMQLKQETKHRLEGRKKMEEGRRQEEFLQMAKKLSEISEQRRRNDHGHVKRREREKIHQGNQGVRPKTDSSLQKGNNMTISMESDLGNLDENYGYSKEYKELEGERVSRSMQQARVCRTGDNSGLSNNQAQTQSASAIGNNYSSPGAKDVGDDDDDGFWSQDSLDEDQDIFIQPGADKVVSFASQYCGKASIDIDEMTDCSAVTLGSPAQKKHSVGHKEKSRYKAPRGKLKPIPIAPYVPIPPQM